MRRISAAFDVLCAAGSRRLRADGGVPTPIFPNFTITAAEPNGTLLQPEAFVPAATTDGDGRLVCPVLDGRRTTNGIGRNGKDNL